MGRKKKWLMTDKRREAKVGVSRKEKWKTEFIISN